ncbi:MAG: hypothetical protein JNL79_17950 [Myxococcales bacterium]|nr:hypothetical protein [Myxococcales bacterium]
MDLKALAGVAFLAALATAFVTAPACVPSCTGTPYTHETGSTSFGSFGAYYESSPQSGPFISFNGHSQLTFPHKFGSKYKIRHVDVRLAFTTEPESSAGGGWTFAAGNQAVVIRQTADEIVLFNDQCTDYYVRVSVDAVEDPGDGGADAATDASDAADAG